MKSLKRKVSEENVEYLVRISVTKLFREWIQHARLARNVWIKDLDDPIDAIEPLGFFNADGANYIHLSPDATMVELKKHFSSLGIYLGYTRIHFAQHLINDGIMVKFSQDRNCRRLRKDGKRGYYWILYPEKLGVYEVN